MAFYEHKKVSLSKIIFMLLPSHNYRQHEILTKAKNVNDHAVMQQRKH